MSDLASVDVENYEKFATDIVERLRGKTFNILTLVGEKKLKYCGRQLTGAIFSRDGQVSLRLKPGGAIAWDLNDETVEIDLGEGADILLSRTFRNGRNKVMLITTGPI